MSVSPNGDAPRLFSLRMSIALYILTGFLIGGLVALAVLPGALIYGVSVQFVSQSIESWFEVQLDSALESGLNLGRGTLDGRLKELTSKANRMALSLSTRPASEHIDHADAAALVAPAFIDDLRIQRQAASLKVSRFVPG